MAHQTSEWREEADRERREEVDRERREEANCDTDLRSWFQFPTPTEGSQSHAPLLDESQMTMEFNDAEDQKLWPPQIERLFIDLMVDECIKGNMPEGFFKRSTWNNMLSELNVRANRSFNHKQLKTKFNRLRTKHRIFSQLLQHTGMGWNPVTNTVTASEEVWQNVLAATPKAKEFKKKGCEHYDKLGVLFNKTTATGLLAFASTQDPTNTEEERELDEQYRYGGIHVNVDADSENEAVEITPNMVKSKCAMHEAKHKDKKAKKEDKISDMSLAIREFTEVSRQRFEHRLAKSSASYIGESKTKTDRFSLDKAFEALDKYTDMPRTSYLKVMKALYKRENRVAFLSISDNRKIEWMESIVDGSFRDYD